MGTTPGGLPYPEGTDLVMDGDEAIEALAKAIDPRLPPAYATGTTIVLNIPAQSVSSIAVTLPAGLFTATPYVTLGINTSAPNVRGAGFSGVSMNGFTLHGWNGSSTQQGLAVSWHALQAAIPSALLNAAADSPVSPAVITCHTDGCPNAGTPIVLDLGYLDYDGNTHHVDAVACGPCGQPVTDIKEARQD